MAVRAAAHFTTSRKVLLHTPVQIRNRFFPDHFALIGQLKRGRVRHFPQNAVRNSGKRRGESTSGGTSIRHAPMNSPNRQSVPAFGGAEHQTPPALRVPIRRPLQTAAGKLHLPRLPSRKRIFPGNEEPSRASHCVRMRRGIIGIKQAVAPLPVVVGINSAAQHLRV